ncbi:MAG: prepilin-type N-terminal cleavage/methylation domain-containing protein [Phycisphaeraceae bacterium]|nr:prepilin-type N-terminal cleavage/methylation domain-containing protein [Phycisphaeraceae bacterium]
MSTNLKGATGRRGRAGFSIVELLIALSISALLLTATLGALDAAWKSYKHTTESASTHVVSRIVIHRMLSLIRTGSEFGPYPADFFDSAQNPVTSNFIEFVSEEDRLAGVDRITRIERRDVAGRPGEYELWYVRLNSETLPAAVESERPLLRGVREALFLLEYEPGPRLVKATLDLTIEPNDDESIATGGQLDTPTIRLVASATPRQLEVQE